MRERAWGPDPGSYEIVKTQNIYNKSVSLCRPALPAIGALSFGNSRYAGGR